MISRRFSACSSERMPCVVVRTAISPPSLSCDPLLRMPIATAPKRRYARAPDPEGGAMPTYVLLSTLTSQGVQTLKSNPDRLREVNRDMVELGARGSTRIQTLTAMTIEEFLETLT